MKKSWMIMVICLFCICGCNSTTYERDTRKGSIETITLSQLQEKIEKKENFSVMLTQSMCGYCMEFENILTTYLPNHRLDIYNVILDKEEASPQENLQIIHQHFPDFQTTPGIYYVENGKYKDQLQPENGRISETNLDTWVQKNRLDKK